MTKGKPFIVEHEVFFNETNAVGGVVYFSNFVKWQGIARESYFVKTVPSWPVIVSLVQDGKINMITKEEHSYFIHHAFFGDRLKIELSTTNIKKFSFDMMFTIKNQNDILIYEGLQRLAFDDFHGNFIEIPEEMLTSIKAHELDPAGTRFKKLISSV